MEHYEIYLVSFLAGLLGTLIQVLVKLNSLQKKARAGNAPIPTFSSYLKEDMVAILVGVVFLTACVFALGDQGVRNYQNIYENWLRSLFIFVGYGGSDLAIRFLGRASDKINKVIDEKTDIADGKK